MKHESRGREPVNFSQLRCGVESVAPGPVLTPKVPLKATFCFCSFDTFRKVYVKLYKHAILLRSALIKFEGKKRERKTA